MVLTEIDHKLITAIQDGLPLTPRPYAKIAEQLLLSEQAVIERIKQLRTDNVIKRFGAVVRHHELGYTANAMVVWDIPDDQADAAGKKLGEFDCVTLCYRRPRQLPLWPYNLFTMIHGKSHDSVIDALEKIAVETGLADFSKEVLFSGRRFRQRGAHYGRS